MRSDYDILTRTLELLIEMDFGTAKEEFRGLSGKYSKTIGDRIETIEKSLAKENYGSAATDIKSIQRKFRFELSQILEAHDFS